MTLDEFTVLTQTWGGDLSRWPPAKRAQAAALAATPPAQAILAEAARLDRRIESLAPHVSDERAARAMFAVVNAIAEAQPARRRPARGRAWLAWLVPATSVAGAAVIGLSLATSVPVDLMRRPADAGMLMSVLIDTVSQDQDWVTQ